MIGFNPNKIQRSPSSKEDSGKIEKEENKETKKEKIVLEIDGQKLEGEKYYFEYPKHIQEETGILGYERNIINGQQIELAINSIKTIEENEDSILSGKTERSFSKKLLMKMTNNKFPHESFNYVMETGADSKDQFSEDKFLLQNIFGLETYKKLLSKNASDAFIPQNPYNPDQTAFLLFNDTDNSEVKDYYEEKGPNSNLSIGEVFQLQELKDLSKKNIYALSANGLNVSDRNFYFGLNILEKDVKAFGFYQQDNLFQNYISDCISKLREINNSNPENCRHRWDSIMESSKYNSIYSEQIFLELFDIKEFNNKNKFRGDWLDYKDYAKELLLKYGSPLSEKDPKYSVDEFVQTMNSAYHPSSFSPTGDYINKLKFITGVESKSHHIPIFINNDKIQQLKWGHASFAAFWTSKGFNLLKIKHADHLPKPKDFKESKKEGE